MTTQSPIPDRQSRAEKVRHVLGAGQTRNHRCHWPNCDKQVPPAMWGCKPHWFKLPKSIRDRIWTEYAVAQEIDMSPSDDYLSAAQAAQDWIAQHG